MKKAIVAVLAAAMCALPVFGLAACGENSAGGVAIAPALHYGEKYFLAGDVSEPEDERDWLSFNANGSGIYHRYSDFGITEISDYTITFKYSFADSQKSKVACFFDSVVYSADDTEKDDCDGWHGIYEIGDGMILCLGMYGYITYVGENYLKRIPNFGKNTD